MYRFAICDDDPADANYVASLIKEWNQKAGIPLQTEKYPSAEAFLYAYQEDNSIDVLFLDIEMGAMSGIQLAKKLRAMNAGLQIVFITGYMEYIDQGYDVEALHYLIKPVDERKLFPVLDRAADNLSYRQRSVLISTSDADIKVSLADITYVESENVYVIVHTVRGDYRTRISLAKFVEQLDDTFLKVHRSFVVGLKYIKKITRTEITMQNGDVVPIRRGMYDDVHAALVRHL